MTRYILLLVLLIIINTGCEQNMPKQAVIEINNSTDDTTQIKELIKELYKWHDMDTSQNEMVPLEDSKGVKYIGMNFDKHRLRLDQLRKSGFFSDIFIENYDKIVKVIDKNLRTGEYTWQVGELPPFGNDANPWCDCQDYPYDNPWDRVLFSFVDLSNSKASLCWTWGDDHLSKAGSEWGKDFKYHIRVVKINGVWKVDWMERFDLEEYSWQEIK